MSENSSQEDAYRAQLIARAQRGDEVAFEKLLRDVLPAVRRYLARFRLPPQDLDDVVQDVSLRIWDGISFFRGDAKFTTWCCTVAKNTALNRLKAGVAQRRELSLEQLLEESGVEPAAGIAEVCADSPEQDLQAKQRLAELVEGIEALPAEQRAVLDLRYEQDLDYEEIAQLQRIPVGTVRSRLHRTRNALGLLGDGSAK